MDLKENYDFLGCNPNKDIIWTFYVAGKANSMPEATSEILEMYDRLLLVCEGFFIPTKITYLLTIESNESPYYSYFSRFGNKSKYFDSYENIIDNGFGIKYNQFKNDLDKIDISVDAVKRFRRIVIYGKTKFILNNKDIYIDSNSPKDLYECGNPNEIDNRYLTYPIKIELVPDVTKSDGVYVTVNDPAYYHLSFWSYTDIWFENTEIGLANRNRLRDVFKKLYNSFKIVGTSFVADRYNEKKLNDIAFGSH